MNETEKRLIDFYQLVPHPEGGYYKETYRSDVLVDQSALPSRFLGHRHCSTAIYFLLVKDSFSAFHKILSDECWHFYEGAAVAIHVLHLNGAYELIKLGNRIDLGEQFQAIVPAGAWFASKTLGAYSLVGCTVSPGFDFNDFELANANELTQMYPEQSALIQQFCRS
jgi:hypothetical protein